MGNRRYQVIFVGGGLSACLAAFRLQWTRPDIDFVVVERDRLLGGNHTWCFHGTDLGDGHWLERFASAAWSRYEVRFRGYRRTVEGGYFAIRSDDFAAKMAEMLGERVIAGQSVTEIGKDQIRLASGTAIHGDCIIDCRGPAPFQPWREGYQKFVGHFVELAEPHGLDAPILMDATVAQRGGYRFVYVLPFAERQLLIEDTRYSRDPAIETADFDKAIASYANRQGWRIESIVGSEHGSLPIPYCGAEPPGLSWPTASIGMRGGLFHATTGYSVADAARFADWFSQLDGTEMKATAVRSYCLAHWQGQQYLRRLNNMMFLAAHDESRWRIFERFYRLDDGLIRRFYGGKLRLRDKLRIVAGRPPVPLRQGIRFFLHKVSQI